MIKRHIKGTTAVFIDASNIYHSQKKLGWRIDFKKLLQYLMHETDVHRVYFYTAYDPAARSQRGFLDFLEIIGYTVRTKKVKFIKDDTRTEGGFHKGNLDVELTIDAVYNLNEYQSVVLFSGDSDFAPLVRFLKTHGKRCIVVSTKGSISIELVKEAKYIDIKRLKNEIVFISK